MTKIFKIIPLLIILLSCTNTRSISYDQTYRPIKSSEYQMQIFSVDDIEKDYKVIGEIMVKANKWTSTTKMMAKIIDRAKKMGADAILDLETSSIGAGSYNGTTAIYSGDAKQLWKAKVIIWQ